MYDGYILQPNAFENMINEEHKETYSDVHFKSTQHLRDHATSARSIAGKKETYTSTDGLGNADPIPPSIMFKMRFDTNKMDRQINEDNEDDEENHKDFVNVVNLDNQAVDDILQMIESEQSKRQGNVYFLKNIHFTLSILIKVFMVQEKIFLIGQIIFLKSSFNNK